MPVKITTYPEDALWHGNAGGQEEDDLINEDMLNPPPVMSEAGFHGFLKNIVEAATAHTEANPVAVAANAIATFSAMAGRRVYQSIGDATNHPRPNFIVVGNSAKARKGTSEHTVDRIFRRADQLHDVQYKLVRHSGGMSSGEGLGWKIRDRDPDADSDDKNGTDDKRLYIVEAEFAGAMAAASREKNTLSANIRTAFDGRTIEPMVKNNIWSATDPHIVISAHITSNEFIAKMNDVDAMNGFINRFLIVHVARPKLVPLPKRTPNDVIDRLAVQVKSCMDFIWDGKPTANNELECVLSPDAEKLWKQSYPRLTKEHDGIVGALLVRTEIYCRMLAMIFALMDRTNVIDPQHIKAAAAWIKYWSDSVQYIFGTLAAKARAEELSKNAGKVLLFIKNNPGASKTDLTKNFKHDMKGNEITEVLNYLMNSAPPMIRQVQEKRSDGKAGKQLLRFWPL